MDSERRRRRVATDHERLDDPVAAPADVPVVIAQSWHRSQRAGVVPDRSHVPRMQYVDVQAGPLDRAYGLARVQLHTAAPGTSAHIPGLPADEAARLRDRLTAAGEAQAAGL